MSEGSPVKKTLLKRVSGGLLLNVFSKTSTNLKFQIKSTLVYTFYVAYIGSFPAFTF